MRFQLSSFQLRLLLVTLLCVCVLLWLTGCRTVSYYAQAVRGQYQVLERQRSCEKLLEDPRTPSPLKAKLQLTQQLRSFAEHDLALPADGHYLHYADLGRPYVVWNVRASPRFSLAEKTWWYPFVGSLSYRGFFTEPDAQELASRLAMQGFDTFVEGVEAYSTLGWFRDPLLNTFIHHSEPELAETLFHELAHQRVFASGDTDFNEAFATAVGQEGARRWLLAKDATNELARYEISLQRERQFVWLVQETRAKLESLYGDERTEEGDLKARKRPLPSASPGQKEEILDRFRRDLEMLRTEWGESKAFESWLSSEVNNARLNSVAAYYDLVPAFERLLATCEGRLDEFYKEANRLARLPKPERRARLAALNRAQ